MTDLPLRTDLIESGADSLVDLPYDTLELRNWGEDSVADPYRIVSESVLNTFVDRLEARRDEFEDLITDNGYWHLPDERIGILFAALRDRPDEP